MPPGCISEFDPNTCCEHVWEVVRTVAGHYTSERCIKPDCKARCKRDLEGRIIDYDLGIQVRDQVRG